MRWAILVVLGLVLAASQGLAYGVYKVNDVSMPVNTTGKIQFVVSPDKTVAVEFFVESPLLNFNGVAGRMTQSVSPGPARTIEVQVTAPSVPGVYSVKYGLQDSGSGMFKGSTSDVMKVTAVAVSQNASGVNVTFNDTNVTLRVYTEPLGAEVVLNGVSVGLSPLNVSVVPGQYEVKLLLSGYNPKVSSLYVGENRTVNYTMSKVEAVFRSSGGGGGGGIVAPTTTKPKPVTSTTQPVAPVAVVQDAGGSSDGSFAQTSVPGEQSTVSAMSQSVQQVASNVSSKRGGGNMPLMVVLVLGVLAIALQGAALAALRGVDAV
jgi:hypothetical protein